MSTSPAPDPFKGLRGIFAGTLIMEAIVVGLAIPVVQRLGAGVGTVGAWYTGVLAVVMLLAAFLQRRPWGLGLALVLQVAMLVGWFAHPALGLLGVVFVLVWGYYLYLRHRLRRHLAARAG